MNKNGVSKIVLIIVICLSLLLVSTNAQPTESTTTPAYLPPLRDMPEHEDYNESTWGSYSYTQVLIKENMQGFYSNYTNMFHYWGDMGRNFITHAGNTHDGLGYAYSPDGVNWNVNPYFWNQEDMRDFATLNYLFDVVLEANGRDFWLVSLNDFHTPPDEVIARKGYLLMNGSIRWYAGKQWVLSGTIGVKTVTYPIDAEVDSNGRLFVSFLMYQSGPIYTAYIRWTDNVNGTFHIDGEEVYESLLSWNKADDYREYMKLNRLADGKMAWTGVFTDLNSLWRIQTHYFNGVDWLDQQERGLHTSGLTETSIYIKYDIVSYGDNLVASYVIRQLGFQRLKVAEATYNTGWTNKTDIVSNYPQYTDLFIPHLTATWDGNIMLFIYKSGSNILNYTYRFSNYTWVTPLIENIINETQATYNWNRFSFMDTTTNIIPFWFQDGSSPYEWSSWSGLRFHYFSWDGSMLPVVFELHNTTLRNPDGSVADEWLFMGERYIMESYITGGSVFEIEFTDSEHDILFKWENASRKLSVENDQQEEFVIGLSASDYIENSDNSTKLIWDFILNKNIVDDDNITFTYTVTIDNPPIYFIGDLDLPAIKIYNLGGKVYYDFNGDGGKITGGDAFELHATNGTDGSNATAQVIFRKLQHMHLLVEIDMDNEVDTGDLVFPLGDGYVEYGFDYRLNNSWVEGWKAKIYVSDADVGTSGEDASWVEVTIDWYNYPHQSGIVKTDRILAYHKGYDKDDFPTPRLSIQLWVDLWFNRMNASTVIGGRINAYESGMYEAGSVWWFGYGEFRPKIGNITSSMFFDDLYDEEGNLTNCKRFELIRVFARVAKLPSADCDDDTWTLKNYEILNWKLADDRMEGVDTPVFVETKDPSMPKTGFISPLITAIQGISTAVTKSIFNVIKLMIGAIDTLLVDILHSPVTMSQMIDWIMIQGSFISDWIITVIEYTSTILNVFTKMVTTLLRVIETVTNWIVWTLVYVVGFPIHFLMVMLSAFQGGTYTIGMFTFDFTDVGELTSSVIQFAPYTIGFMFLSWFVFGDVDMNKDDYTGMPKRLMIVFRGFRDVYKDVYWIFSAMQNKVVELYNFIRGHIPGIGGSGGKTEE